MNRKEDQQPQAQTIPDRFEKVEYSSIATDIDRNDSEEQTNERLEEREQQFKEAQTERD